MGANARRTRPAFPGEAHPREINWPESRSRPGTADLSRYGRCVPHSLPEDRPDGLDYPVTVKVIKAMSRSQVLAFRLTNGRVGSNWRIGAGFRKPVPTLLLDHVGRKSGKRFTTPLLYLDDGDRLVASRRRAGCRRTRSGT